MKRLLPLTIVSLLVPAMTARPARAEQPMYVVRSVSVPVEFKDPFKAYCLGMVPLGGHAAANYVGTTRFSWSPAAEYKLNALTQSALDVVLLAAGGTATYLGARDGNTPLLAGGVVGLLAVPLVHVTFFAPYWGDTAVQLNRQAMVREGYKAPEAP